MQLTEGLGVSPVVTGWAVEGSEGLGWEFLAGLSAVLTHVDKMLCVMLDLTGPARPGQSALASKYLRPSVPSNHRQPTSSILGEAILAMHW